MLPWSLNTPAAASLLSSESLNVVTPATHLVGVTESVSPDSTGTSSAGTEAPVKKTKITLTEKQERFAKQFHPPASKIDRKRKISVRHVVGRDSSTKSKEHDNMM
jgi:hypothetical protein